MRFDRGHGYDRPAGDVPAVRCGRSAVPTGSARAAAPRCQRSRRIAIPRPGRSAEGPCADCGNDADFDEYCTVCGHRRAEPDRDEADLGGIVLITDRGLEHAAQRGCRRGRDAGGQRSPNGPMRSPSPCATGSRPPVSAHVAAVAASTAGVDAMLAALVASRKARAAVLAGLRAAANGRRPRPATDPASAPSCTYTAATVVPTSAGNSADHGRQRRRQQGVLASRTARSAATADGRRLGGAGTDHRGRRGRFGSRATRRAHPDPLARRRHRSEAVVGLERADDHRRRSRLAAAVHATDCGTTCPTPPTSHDSAAVPTRARRRAHSPNTHCDAGGHDNITVAVIPIGGTS